MNDINIRTLVALEVIVPVEYTEDEKRAVIDGVLVAVDETVARTEAIAAATSTEVLPQNIEKATAGALQLSELAASLRTLLESGNFDEAMPIAKEAEALLTDVNTLLGPVSESEVPVVEPEVEVPVTEEVQGTSTASTSESGTEETI